MSAENLILPSEKELIAGLLELGQQVESIARCIDVIKTGRFIHPPGRIDDLGAVRISLGQAALLSHLARVCPTSLSVEVGFGMGSSATIILGTRAAVGKPFEHFVYDAFGLPDGRGKVVQDYLQSRFSRQFRLVEKRSELGLANLLDTRGFSQSGLLFIDGGHRFENVMADFTLCDLLCCVGGYIVLDDAWYPAIETVSNYVMNNRPDYVHAHPPIDNTCVFKRIGPDRRDWSAFKPFSVPNRFDWEPLTSAVYPSTS
jgi:hypothetical protein